MIRFEHIPGMRTIFFTTIFAAIVGVAGVIDGQAQQVIVGSVPAQAETTTSDQRQRIGENHDLLFGHVELQRGDTTIFADRVELFSDQDRAIATGNVVLSQATSRIAADRAEFNIKTKLGTFYNAWGMATVQQPGKPRTPAYGMPGAPPPPPDPNALLTAGRMPTTTVAPALGISDTDVYFFGEMIEKVGPRKYEITNGGFTTCVQPTPRWQLSSSSLVLNLDHYTLLRNAVFTVKGVPMLYTPILYYPTKRDGRATGILLPTYGVSTLRGQSFHNAFFWAIDRSKDATFMYDWFSNASQGFGGEYRYNFGGGSDGELHSNILDQRASTYPLSDGTLGDVPASRSYELRGTANQVLPGHFRTRAHVDYFSSITSMQTLNTNVYDATRTSRSYGANIVGRASGLLINGTLEHGEYFYGTTSSAVNGTWPQVAVSNIEQPLFGSPVYFGFNGNYTYLLRDSRLDDVSVNSSLGRMEIAPTIRYPFKKWPWFTVNSTINWRDTFYTRSLNPGTTDVVDESVNRLYFTFQSSLLGPVFTRIWDTPRNGYAEKFKHSIEPFMIFTSTTAIDNYDRIVKLDGSDSIIGGVKQYTYGVANRVYAKRPQKTGPATAVAIFSIDIRQTYYSDELASQVDTQYNTSFTGAAPSNFSPISLSGTAAVVNGLNATVRAEFDTHYLFALRTISASGTYDVPNRLTETVGWSKRALIPGLTGFDDPGALTHYLSSTTNLHMRDNRLGGIYSFNYDVINGGMLQQRLTGFYNSQCCGLAFEYQTFRLGSTFTGLESDHRFFMSFTLAGLGNFSPFSGALSAIPR